MEKEELERELEKAEKGCVITVINQSSHPLSFDGSKHPHGKFKAKPPKAIPAREAASFSLEGRKSIEASVKFRWGKGRLELFWNMPEQGDPKIFYRVAPQLKNKLFVYIPSAVFGKVTKFIFLVDEKPATPITAQELSSHSNPDTNDDVSSENVSDGENEMNRSASNGEIALTPKVLFDPSQLKSPTGPTLKLGDDDESKGSGFSRTSSDHSFGFSSDEEDEPKKLKFVIRPPSEEPRDIPVPVITGIAPPSAGPPSTRRRSNTKTKENGLFGDFNDSFFQSSNTSVLSPTLSSPTNNPPTRERRLSMSDDSGGNKFNSIHGRNSLPSDLNFNSQPQLSPPPHLTTPPLIPQSSPLPSNSSFSFGALSPTLASSAATSPVGIMRSSSKSSFELRMSFDELRTLTSSSGPLTPKPTHTQEKSLVPRPSSVPTPLIPSSSIPKSPPIIAASPPPNSAVLIPQKAASFNNALSPSKQQLGNAPPQASSSLSFDSPARAMYAPMSPPLQRQPSIGRGLGNGHTMLDSDPKQAAVPRRYSEPPPVDLNLLFPEIAAAKERNKKPDVLVTAQKYIQAAMAHLERNSIAAALGNLDLCISLLGTIPDQTVHELEYCMRYRIFLVLLKEIAKPKPPIEHAFLSFFLTDIAVKPQHRVVAIRMAIRHNINSQNFGIAAWLIQFLVERIHPVDENILQEKLRKCMAQNRANADQRFKKYTCPGCEATTSVSSMKCGLCQQSIRLCALTLEIINTKAYYSCKLCKLSFSRKSISPRDTELKCPFCKVGDLTNKIFISSK